MFAGLRIDELTALRWRDVDLAANRITVGSSMTDAGLRQIDLLPALREELAAHKAGDVPLPEGLTPHKLRHTFASILVALGVDPGSVMDQLGHAHPSFTLRVYRHAMRRDDAARERLRALVGGEFRQRKGSDGVRTPSTGPVAPSRIDKGNPPPCPRQESNLDLPLRRTKDEAAGSCESLGTATVLVGRRACRSSAIGGDRPGFRQGIDATA